MTRAIELARELRAHGFEYRRWRRGSATFVRRKVIAGRPTYAARSVDVAMVHQSTISVAAIAKIFVEATDAHFARIAT